MIPFILPFLLLFHLVSAASSHCHHDEFWLLLKGLLLEVHQVCSRRQCCHRYAGVSSNLELRMQFLCERVILWPTILTAIDRLLPTGPLVLPAGFTFRYGILSRHIDKQTNKQTGLSTRSEIATSAVSQLTLVIDMESIPSFNGSDWLPWIYQNIKIKSQNHKDFFIDFRKYRFSIQYVPAPGPQLPTQQWLLRIEKNYWAELAM